MNTYPIRFGKDTIGKATIAKVGLYYCITCICNLPDGTISRIVVKCGDRNCDLGICVPEASGFTLTKHISIKQLGEGEMEFYIIRDLPVHNNLISISETEWFTYIDMLEQARFLRIDGKPYIKLDISQENC